MRDGRERSDGESTAFPACSRCGRPVTSVTVVGPTDAFAAPCGCRVAPGMLERRADDGDPADGHREREHEPE